MKINIEQLKKVKEEIFDKYIGNKDDVIDKINEEVDKLLENIEDKKQEDIIDE